MGISDGRRAAGPRPDRLLGLGVDIGGTKISAGIVDAGGRLLARAVLPTPARGAKGDVYRTVVGLAGTLRARLGPHEPVTAVGIGCNGIVDFERGAVVAASLLPGWDGAPVREELTDLLGLPVTVDNDVNAFALGEQRWGAGADCSDVLYITVGTGVGGAVVTGRTVRRGTHWAAGELGHVPVALDSGVACSCGRPGHLEGLASGPAITRDYARRSRDAEVRDLREVVRRARDDDPAAVAALGAGASVLGRAIAGMVHLLDVDAVVVGGGVMQIGDLYHGPLVKAYSKELIPDAFPVPLRAAALGTDGVVLGAGALALDEVASPAL
ncbi:ROK family protein [Streptomyces sp. NPDC059629]|uniref:ROK family protein n=1 Tax=Streptomyces sp. NPDC059629 TaxID=3346889 RepID=UPI0036C4CE09